MSAGVYLFCLLAVQADQPVLRIEDLSAEVLRVNPDVLAAQKAVEAARQRPAQAGSLPDPMISAGYSSNGSPVPGAGLGREPTSNIGFMVTQQLPGPGKLKLKSNIAQKEADEVFQAYLQTQRRVIMELRQAYHTLHHSWVVMEVLDRNRTLLERMVRVTEARYASGQSAQQDIFKAQAQITLLETRKTRSDLERTRAEAAINTLLGRAPGSPLGKPPMLTARESLATLEQLTSAARETSPLLFGEQKRVEKTQLALNLAQKERQPDYAVSAGYFNMGSMADMYQVRVDFNLPTIFTAKKRAAEAEQAHMLSQTRRSYQAADQTLLFRIKDEYLISSTAWKLMQMYATALIPQSTLALESSLSSYQTGRVDFLTLLANLQSLLEYEMNYHEEMMNYHLALARLEELTGLRLIGD